MINPCVNECGREAMAGDHLCAQCAAELEQMMINSRTPEEKNLAIYRELVKDLVWQNRVLNFNLQHESDPNQRMLAVAHHLTWQDQRLAQVKDL